MFYPLTMMARSLTLPVLVLLLAALALPWVQSYSSYPVLLQWAPYVSALAVMGVGLIFNQLRPFMIASLILIAFWLLLYLRADSGAAAVHDPVTRLAYTWLVPLCIVLLAGMREVSLFSRRALMILLVVAIPFGALILVARLGIEVIPTVAQQWWTLSERVTLPVEFAVFSIGALCLSARLWQQPTALNAGLLLLMPALAAAFHWRALPDAPPIAVSAASGILLLVVLLETQRVAYRDDLTGLPSRRALNLRLATLGRRYVIAMLDVDHFKKFNDRYGHDVGDQVLRVVARQLAQVKGGTAYRYGGEEFAIVFPGRTIDFALPRLELVRQSIADYRLVLRSRGRPLRKPKEAVRPAPAQKSVRVTISIGVAERGPQRLAATDVIQAADKSLYKAKKAGRNRISA